MAKEKTVKTNAMRILDRMKIDYEVITVDLPEFVDGVQMAELEGVPAEESFKTLVLQGKSREYYVFVLPVEKEVDLKAAAACVGEKNIGMIHVKDITKITGYVRGGCSPVGMKKLFPTVIDLSANNYPTVCVSAGRVGYQIELAPEDLVRMTGCGFAELI